MTNIGINLPETNTYGTSLHLLGNTAPIDSNSEKKVVLRTLTIRKCTMFTIVAFIVYLQPKEDSRVLKVSEEELNIPFIMLELLNSILPQINTILRVLLIKTNSLKALVLVGTLITTVITLNITK